MRPVDFTGRVTRSRFMLSRCCAFHWLNATRSIALADSESQEDSAGKFTEAALSGFRLAAEVAHVLLYPLEQLDGISVVGWHSFLGVDFLGG